MAQMGFDKERVRRPFEGRREAERITERERVNFSLPFTPEKSLEIYLSLSRLGCKGHREPSFVLLKMRRCLKRWTDKNSLREGEER